METVVIVGVDGVVGANLAQMLAASSTVMGVARLSKEAPAATHVLSSPTPAATAELLRSTGATRLVYCGAGAESCWNAVEVPAVEQEHVHAWMAGATATATSFTVISSDAVFTGPWMFHSENSGSLCRSPQAEALRAIEAMVLAQRPDALIMRTHAFGWGPTTTSSSWLEQMLSSHGSETSALADPIRHASPILASDLAPVLSQAWTAGLTGIYHVAGAERINPLQFARRLAPLFGQPIPLARPASSLCDVACGFGCGETSLQTRKIRRALGISMPLLHECFARLLEQSHNGYRTRLQGPTPRSRAA